MNTTFDHIGYLKEFYLGTKLIGVKTHVEKDREVIGYNGRKQETFSEEIVLDNKKKIKAGTTVMTFLYPMCGRSNHQK